MSGLEVEATVINWTIVLCLVAKAAKWVLEELQPTVLEYGKLRDCFRKVRGREIRVLESAKPSPPISVSNDTRSKDESDLAA
jgi:hypothetical protein